MSATLIEQKRDYLRRAVKQLKDQGILQKDIAARMGENEGAFSGKLSGQRGITDDYIDRFIAEFKIPFSAGAMVEQGFTPEAVERLMRSAEAQSNTMLQLLDEFRKQREELKTLREELAALKK